MKCAVIGGSVLPKDFDENQRVQCEMLGRWIADLGIEILTGACDGYPYMVSVGALAAGGKVVGYSPAIDAREHTLEYDHPVDAVSTMVFLDDYPSNSNMQRLLARSLPLVEESDFVLCIEGSWGTLMELVGAVCMSKPIITVNEFGGIAARFENLFLQMQGECQHPFSSELIAVQTMQEAREQIKRISEMNQRA